jgi:hypothetical protein
MSPSDLAWWAWLLLSAGLGIGGLLLIVRMGESPSANPSLPERIGALIGILAMLAGVISFLIGIVRLIKWVWQN